MFKSISAAILFALVLCAGNAQAQTGTQILKDTDACIDASGSAKLQNCKNSLVIADRVLAQGESRGIEKLKIYQAKNTGWTNIAVYYASIDDYGMACRAAESVAITHKQSIDYTSTLSGYTGMDGVKAAQDKSAESMIALLEGCRNIYGQQTPLSVSEL